MSTNLDFEWDASKEISNRRKHGVSFGEARSVFADEHARLMADPDHSHSEDRFVLLGVSGRSRLLVVCHCLRRESTVRIISARKASRRERSLYDGFRNA